MKITICVPDIFYNKKLIETLRILAFNASNNMYMRITIICKKCLKLKIV